MVEGSRLKLWFARSVEKDIVLGDGKDLYPNMFQGRKKNQGGQFKHLLVFTEIGLEGLESLHRNGVLGWDELN